MFGFSPVRFAGDGPKATAQPVQDEPGGLRMRIARRKVEHRRDTCEPTQKAIAER